MKGVPFPLYPGEIDVEFRFTIRAARDLERLAGCNFQTLFARGQQVEAVCLLLWAALRHADPKLTAEKAVDIVEQFVDRGGNIVALYEALQKAMDKSGCYAPALPDEADPARPTPVPAGEAVLSEA